MFKNKIFIILSILLTISLFLFVQEIINADKFFFSQSQINNSIELYKNFFLLNKFLFFFLSSLWIFFLGFGTPILVLAVLIYDIFFAIFIVFSSFVLGASALFFFSKELFKKYLKKKLKIKNLKNYFSILKKSQNFNYLIIRLIPGIPFPLKNILPAFTKMKYFNFIFIFTLVELPTITINVFLYSGIKNAIINYENVYNSILNNYYLIIPLLIIIIVSYFKIQIKKMDLFKKK